MKIYLFIDDHIKLYSKLLLNGTINASNKVLRKNWSSWPVWPEKIPKCLLKLPKNDFTRKIIDSDTFSKIA